VEKPCEEKARILEGPKNDSVEQPKKKPALEEAT